MTNLCSKKMHSTDKKECKSLIRKAIKSRYDYVSFDSMRIQSKIYASAPKTKSCKAALAARITLLDVSSPKVCATVPSEWSTECYKRERGTLVYSFAGTLAVSASVAILVTALF